MAAYRLFLAVLTGVWCKWLALSKLSPRLYHVVAEGSQEEKKKLSDAVQAL